MVMEMAGLGSGFDGAATLGENLLRVGSAVERHASARGHEAQCRSDVPAEVVH